MSDKFNPEDMPVLSLSTTGTTRYEASRFLDTSETIAAYLGESMKEKGDRFIIRKIKSVPFFPFASWR